MIDKPKSIASPWRRTAVIYAILALGAFAFPGGIVGWLDERNGTGRLAAPLALARGVETISGAIGLKFIGAALRERFQAFVGDTDS